MPQPFFCKVGSSISPRRFVIIDGSFAVSQATAGAKVFGISQSNVHGAPGTPWDDGFAAVGTTDPTTNYNQLLVYQLGDTTLLDSGAPITAGNLLKADANGRGIPVASDGDYYGAVAAESTAASGAAIRVTVVLGSMGVAP